MTFPVRLLNPGEEIAVEVHPHWKYLAPPVGAGEVVVAGAVAAAVMNGPPATSWAVLVALCVVILWLLVRYLRWRTISLVITNPRLIDRQGVLSRSGREIPLDQLTNISYRQTILDRIVGGGDLLLESAGRGREEVFPDVPRPAFLQNEIYRQLSSSNRAAGPSVAGSGSPSIPEQIARLDQLRRQGVLTQAEFDAKKADLLSRL